MGLDEVVQRGLNAVRVLRWVAPCAAVDVAGACEYWCWEADFGRRALTRSMLLIWDQTGRVDGAAICRGFEAGSLSPRKGSKGCVWGIVS